MWSVRNVHGRTVSSFEDVEAPFVNLMDGGEACDC